MLGALSLRAAALLLAAVALVLAVLLQQGLLGDRRARAGRTTRPPRLTESELVNLFQADKSSTNANTKSVERTTRPSRLTESELADIFKAGSSASANLKPVEPELTEQDPARILALMTRDQVDASSKHLRQIGDALRLWDESSTAPPAVIAEYIRIAHEALGAAAHALDELAEERNAAIRLRFAERTGLLVNFASGQMEGPPGFVTVDGLPPADVETSLLRRLPFADGSLRGAYCSHFLEHLYSEEARHFLAEVFAVLESGGTLRIVVPDIGRLLRAYVEGDAHVLASHKEMFAAKSPTQGSGGANKSAPPVLGRLLRYAGVTDILPQYGSVGDTHRRGFDFEGLRTLLVAAGFVDVRETAHGESRDGRLGECDQYSATASTTVASGPNQGAHLSLFVEASKPPAAASVYRTDEVCELGWDLHNPHWQPALEQITSGASTHPLVYDGWRLPATAGGRRTLADVRRDESGELAHLPVVHVTEVRRIEGLHARLLPFVLRGVGAAIELTDRWGDIDALAAAMPNVKGHVIAHCGVWHGFVDPHLWKAQCNSSRRVPLACDPEPTGRCDPLVESDRVYFERLAIRGGVPLGEVMAERKGGTMGREGAGADVRWSWEALLSDVDQGPEGAEARAALERVFDAIPGRRIGVSRGDPERRTEPSSLAEKWVVRLGWDAYARSIHFDAADNYIIDVSPAGKRSHRQRTRVILGHPWQSGPLEIEYGQQSARWRHSAFDPLDPSPAVQARLRQVGALQHIMERGDVLFVPAFWWHHVVLDEAHEWISLNRFANERSTGGSNLHPCPDKVG